MTRAWRRREEAPIQLKPRLSVWLFSFLLGIHALAVLLPWVMLGQPLVSGAISLLALVSAGFALRSGYSWRGMVLHLLADGRVLCVQGEREQLRVASKASRELGGVLVILAWQAQSGPWCLPRDALSAEEWRCLRRWLRWQVLRPAASEPGLAANADS